MSDPHPDPDSPSDRASPSILDPERPRRNAQDEAMSVGPSDDEEPARVDQGTSTPASPTLEDLSDPEHQRDWAAMSVHHANAYMLVRGILDTVENIEEQRIQSVLVADEDSSSNSNMASIPSEDSNQSAPETETNADSNTDSVAEPPTKVRKINSPVKKDDVDGETCPICLDIWGNSGSHRLVALKCGHLFGSECVERWLKAQSSKDRACPTCKSKASLRDIRFIYARKLIAADTSEITRLQQHVETLQAEKNRTELKLHTAQITQSALAAQLEHLKKTISKTIAIKQEAERRSWRFCLEKNQEMCKDGGCRVLTYNCRTYELYVSQKSSNYLFPGYGIRKVSYVDYTLGQFVHLHPKPIRDIVYSQPSDLLLSVGLDSTARIVERGIPNVTVHAGFPLWSCAWDHHRTNEFYAGGVGGMIHQYDFRNPSTSIRTLSGTGDMSPVVSVCSTEYGLLSCQLNSCWLWEPKSGEWAPKAFPVTGAFMSMCYSSEASKILISMRPKGSERSKLVVCSLAPNIQGGADLEVDNVINGSTRTSVMSRATFCRTPGSSWVAAHSESDAALYLHGMDGSKTMTLPAAEPALDVCSVQMNGESILAALSESRLRIYKAVQTDFR